MKKIIVAFTRFYANCWKKIRERIANKMIARMIKSGQFNVISLDADDDLDPLDLKLMTKEDTLLVIK